MDDRLGKYVIFIIQPIIDHLTDTAAILNLLDLRSIMGYPGGHEHDPIYWLSIYAHFSGQLFFRFS